MNELVKRCSKFMKIQLDGFFSKNGQKLLILGPIWVGRLTGLEHYAGEFPF